MWSCAAASRNRRSSSGETVTVVLLLSQSSDTGRCGLTRGGRIRAERDADVRVVEVVPVAQDHGRALGRRELRGEMLELGKRRATVFVGELRQFGVVARAPVLVDRDAACDRECPRTEMVAVAQAGIRA